MTSRKKQMLEWVVANFDKWPAPFDTNPDGPDAEDIGAAWSYDPNVSCLPVLRCRFGGGSIDSMDWFYNRQKVNENWRRANDCRSRKGTEMKHNVGHIVHVTWYAQESNDEA